jgi:hypothetical protein
VGELGPSTHRTLIVRVEVRDASSRDAVIELLEVGRSDGSDESIGWTDDPDEAAAFLLSWLRDVLERASDADVTLVRPAGGARPSILGSSTPEDRT